MYFKPFPILNYTLDNGNSYQEVQDILRRVLLEFSVKTNGSVYQLYDVQDGETPEIVAHKFYGNTNAHWIILHANEIIDPRFDWVMSQIDLEEYCKNKYGEDKLYDIHHYEWVIYEGTPAEQRLILTPEQKEFLGPKPLIPEDDLIEASDSTINYTETITNLEYETRLNEEKRTIKVIARELVNSVLTEFSTIIKQ